MTQSFRLWWSGRSVREQRMLLAMFGLLAIVLVWVGMILPVDNALSDARQRHGRAVIEHARVAARVEAARELRRATPPPLEAEVAAIVSQSASEVGFVLSRIEAVERDKASLSIASARPIAFFGWLQTLEQRGIFPETLRARANSDQTLNIEAVFRGRAPR